MFRRATEYVTVNDLPDANAGITFADLDTVTAAARADGFSSTRPTPTTRPFPLLLSPKTGKTEVPAILALTWASGSGTLARGRAAAAKNTKAAFRLRCDEYQANSSNADQSAQGKRLASNIAPRSPSCTPPSAEDPWVNPFRDVTRVRLVR